METTPPVVSAESLPLDPRGSTAPDDLDVEGEKLRKLAIDTDYGALTQEEVEITPKQQDSTQKPDRAPEADTTETPDSPETSADRDEKGRFLPKAKDEVKEEQKPETAYDKAKKEQERQKSVLAKFEEEKQRERAALAAERQKLEQERLVLQQQARQGQAPRFSSQHLWQAAEEFEKQARDKLREGDVDAANSQLDLAAKSRTEAQKTWYYEQQEAYQQQANTHRQKWETVAQQVIEQNPDLANPDTDIAKHMQELLQAEPIFGQIEDGFKKAFEVAQMRKAYGEVSGLRDENTKLKQQLKELQDRTAITGSGAQPHMEAKSFDQMSEAEQEEFLRRNAAQYDRERFAA